MLCWGNITSITPPSSGTWLWISWCTVNMNLRPSAAAVHTRYASNSWYDYLWALYLSRVLTTSASAAQLSLTASIHHAVLVVDIVFMLRSKHCWPTSPITFIASSGSVWSKLYPHHCQHVNRWRGDFSQAVCYFIALFNSWVSHLVYLCSRVNTYWFGLQLQRTCRSEATDSIFSIEKLHIVTSSI